MKTLMVILAMVLVMSCSSITEPTIEPKPLLDGIAVVEALILNVDYPTWTASIKVIKLLNKGEGCPVWKGDEIDLDNSPYDYTVGLTYTLTIQYIPIHSGGVWVVVKEETGK